MSLAVPDIDPDPDPETVRRGRIFLACYGGGLGVFIIAASIVAELSQQPMPAPLGASATHYDRIAMQKIMPRDIKNPIPRFGHKTY